MCFAATIADLADRQDHLTNPFVTNPDSKVKIADFPKVDAILVADGHGDDVGSAAEIALATVYFAGSTAPTLDMTMWGRLYKPDVKSAC